MENNSLLNYLVRIMANHHDHFTILKFTTGWKCVVGTPHLENSDDPKSDYQILFRHIKTKGTIEEAILDCIERGEF